MEKELCILGRRPLYSAEEVLKLESMHVLRWYSVHETTIIVNRHMIQWVVCLRLRQKCDIGMHVQS
jgi:hypothetical protein